jgi:hypothetical protein
VWYATTKRARSARKFIVYDDIGSLMVQTNRIEFRGSTSHVTIARVEQLRRMRQSWNWVAYLIINLAVSPTYLLWWFISERFFGSQENFVILLILAVNLFGFVIGRSVTWIVVTGRDDADQPVEAWFASGAKQGWAGIFGATRCIYDHAVSEMRAVA